MNEDERILQIKMKGYLWPDGKFIICLACCKLQVDYVFRQLEEASCLQTLQVLDLKHPEICRKDNTAGQSAWKISTVL